MKRDKLTNNLSDKVGKNYHPLLSIKDPHFDATNLSQYHLSIYISDTSFRISCFNPVTKRCLLLESYVLAYGQGQQRVLSMEQLCQDHQILALGDWSAVTLYVGTQQYTLVPNQFFRERKLAAYLDFSCPSAPHMVRYFIHTSLDLSLVFAVDPLLASWVQHTYQHPQLHIIHQASSLIEGTLQHMQNSKPSLLPNLLVFVETNYLHVIIVQNSKLLYYNRFRYTSSNEFLNYILVVMHTLGLDPGLQKVYLGGNISKNSTAYQEVRRYIGKLFFIQRPSYSIFGSVFDRRTLTTHWDLLNTYLCR